MKKTIIFSLLLLTSGLVIGQSDTTSVIFNTLPIKIRGEFSFGYQTSTVNQEPIHSIGPGFGVNINRKYFVGFYGTVSVNSPKNIAWGSTPINPIYADQLSFIEAGGILGYRLHPHKAIHFSAYSKFSNVYIEDNGTDVAILSDKAFVWIPEIEAEFNLTKSMRLGLGLGYRITNNKALFFQQNETTSLVFKAFLKFGRFSR